MSDRTVNEWLDPDVPGVLEQAEGIKPAIYVALAVKTECDNITARHESRHKVDNCRHKL